VRVTTVARFLAPLLFFFAALAGIPLAISLVDPAGNPHGPRPWLATIALGWAAAAGLRWIGRRADPEDLHLREGLALTALFWFGASLIAAVGIHLGTPPEVTWSGSLFEAVSGLTTTGSSVLGGPVAPESLDPSLLMWRSLLQWLGGIGIVVMALTLLPLFAGGGGFALFRSEVPGIRAERLVPRIADTARILVLFYLALTAAVTAGLLACGVGTFDAVNHAMTTVSTGGFSTRSDSVEGLRSPAAEWVIIAGMYLAALDFGLMLRSLAGRPDGLFASSQWRWFSLVLIAATALVVLVLAADGRYASLHDLVRDSAFQVASIGSSTGFGTGYDVSGYGGASWEAWPAAAAIAILALMAVGGCTGSTAGGFKFARLLVLIATARREVRHPLIGRAATDRHRPPRRASARGTPRTPGDRDRRDRVPHLGCGHRGAGAPRPRRGDRDLGDADLDLQHGPRPRQRRSSGELPPLRPRLALRLRRGDAPRATRVLLGADGAHAGELAAVSPGE